jgi:hypothetical protein
MTHFDDTTLEVKMNVERNVKKRTAIASAFC